MGDCKCGAWDEIRDMVYELNMQMCDLERGLSHDFLDIQARIADKLAKDVVEGVKTLDRAKNMLASVPEQLIRAKYEILDEILKEKNRFMKEKNTKKMTKAEAFEYLKGKKVRCYDFNKMNDVQHFAISLGYDWGGQINDVCLVTALGFGENGKLGFYLTEDLYNSTKVQELDVDDILSIEIVEEKKEKFVECNKPCDEIKAVQELLRNSKYLKDKTLVITKDNAAIL